LKLTANKRLSKIERKAAPLIQRAVEEIEREQLEQEAEEVQQAHYWKYIGHYFPEVAEAARKATAQFDEDEEIDPDKMTPENQRAWQVFQALGDSIETEEFNRYHRVYLAQLLELPDDASEDDINAELVSRGFTKTTQTGSHIFTKMYDVEDLATDAE
jgi:hypothetical protein